MVFNMFFATRVRFINGQIMVKMLLKVLFKKWKVGDVFQLMKSAPEKIGKYFWEFGKYF